MNQSLGDFQNDREGLIERRILQNKTNPEFFNKKEGLRKNVLGSKI